MIRILFTIVAVVAAILGVVLPMPELFIAAGLALLVTVGLVLARVQRRRSSHKPATSRHVPGGSEGGDDLASLGILDIRPRQKGGPSETHPRSAAETDPRNEIVSQAATPSRTETVSRHTQGGARHEAPPMVEQSGSQYVGRGAVQSPSTRRSEDRPPPVIGDGALDDFDMIDDDSADEEHGATRRVSGPSRAETDRDASYESDVNGTGASAQASISVKERGQTVRTGVDDRVPDHYRDVLVPYLQSFRAAIQAHTVCLLKQPIDALHHQIEGIVSLNAYARSGGDFAAKVPLLQTRESRTTEIRRVADDDFPASGLGYYREAIAVKEIAVTPVPGEAAGGQYILLADSMRERTFDSDRIRSLTRHFARLLGAVMDDASGGEVLDSYDSVRPRREIINEEIERARLARRPLALALVHLNRAESVADLGEREVKSQERVLAAHLRRTARNARVERFGELTFGVFFSSPAKVVEKWATHLHRELAQSGGPLEGGVSIGIAVLQDRHEDADALRRDATDALREAYESGTCTIVE